VLAPYQTVMWYSACVTKAGKSQAKSLNYVMPRNSETTKTIKTKT